MTRNGVFPYPYRPCQKAMVEFVRSGVAGDGTVVMESGTGTGKTAVSLSGAIEGRGRSARIVYLTRTKSQQRQVALECRAISDNIPLISVAVQGRSASTCPMMAHDRDLSDGTPEELSRLCSDLKKGDGPAGKCEYFEAMGSTQVEACISYIRTAHPDPEEFAEFCGAMGVCPYEMAKKVLPYADVVSAPYPFFFIPAVRSRLMDWMGTAEKDVVAIIDEAHNLPEYLREIQTYTVTARSLELSRSEAEANGNPLLGSDVRATDLVDAVRDVMDDATDEFLTRENDLIPPDYLSTKLMSRFSRSTVGIKNLFVLLHEAGMAIAEKKKAKRKLPRSHLATLALFILGWLECDDESHVFLIAGGDNPSLEAYCLDPADAAEPLRLCRSSVSMSGTLEPLRNYAWELGLREPETETFPSPFPPENRRTVFVRDISTRYADLYGPGDTYGRLKDYVIGIVDAAKVNTAVFFPSYSLMERFIDDGVDFALRRDVFYERAGSTQAELMDQVMGFRTTPGSVLFAVTGGRISEGLDFPGREMELAVIVGIPYGRPSAKTDALIRYCQGRFGDGFGMAMKVPAVRKMRQAIGRLIRSENDRGIAVILDNRVPTLPGLDAEPTDDPVADVRSFFE